jgi:uncharacterized protein (TIGR02594 family)
MKEDLKRSKPILLGGIAAAAVALTISAASPADARPVKAHVRSAHHDHHSYVGPRHARGRQYAKGSHRRHYVRARGARTVQTAAAAQWTSAGYGGGSDIVSEARRWLGGNPTNRRSLWCAAFMNFVLERTGHHGTGSNLASSFARYGRRISGPQVGAIAVMSRRGGGHVGVVSGFDSAGNPIVISGNHGRRVAESVYRRGRIYAYVMP